MRKLLPALAAAAAISVPASARIVEEIEVPESLQREGSSLTLNGAGVRSRFFVDLYVSGLYLRAPSSDAVAILDADEIMTIKLWIVTDLITRERMQRSIREGFARSTDGEIDPIRGEIEALVGLFDGEIEDGDEYELVYLPGEGVRVYENGLYRATVAAGLGFKRALFGIWISERSVQRSLRRALLGG